MAKAMDVHPRTIQKHIAALEGAGYIRREERRTETSSRTNIYHLDGLIKAVAPLAAEKMTAIKNKDELAKRRQHRAGAPKRLQVQDDDERTDGRRIGQDSIRM